MISFKDILWLNCYAVTNLMITLFLQVKFSQWAGTMSRPDLPKFRQQPWAVYGQIEWEGRVFKRGMLVSNLILPRALKYFRNFFFPDTCCSKEST